MKLAIEFAMWLALFGFILVSFLAALLEFVIRDTTEYDMEFLWDNKYTLEELNLKPYDHHF